MNELTTNKTITSLELVKEINVFRKNIEGKAELQHKSLLTIIRNEFDDEITEGKILLSEYKDSTGRKLPMYNLTISQAKQLLVRESKAVRKAVINRLDTLENIVTKLIVPSDSYMIQDPVERAERWIVEQKEHLSMISHLERTKAHINDKRTATLSGKVGGLTKAKNELERKLDEATDYISVNRVKKYFDVNYQTDINLYHKDVWNACYNYILG